MVGTGAAGKPRHTARLNKLYRYATIDLAWSDIEGVACQLAKTRSRLDVAFATRHRAHSTARPQTKPDRL